MRGIRLVLTCLLASLVAAVPIVLTPANAAPPADKGSKAKVHATDKLKSPLADKQAEMRTRALERKLSGDKAAQGKIVKTRKGQYVPLAREGTSKLFVIVTEFSDASDPRYSTYRTTRSDGLFGDEHVKGAPIPGYTNPGPLKNRIAAPDRSIDNTTIYRPDNSQPVLQKLYFDQSRGANSMSNYFLDQSSGRFTFEGQVTDWVKVPYNEASYGSDYCDSQVCANTWNLISDGVNAWVAQQKAAGQTDAQIKDYLKQYDVEDRYDFDGDGDFNEPDGYLDRFQILHAGQDGATGGGQNPGDGDVGENAIWSHSWYANASSYGTTGPANNKAGGAQIGDTGVWVGDYTIQPENAGIGVLAHETAHDLGLPDEYDTSYLGESSVGFWSAMASGSYMNDGQDLGSKASDLSAWDKLQLGWLNYDVVRPGSGKTTRQMGPVEYNTKKTQGTIVVLPKKQVTREYVKPASGTYEWWSTKGDDISTTMSRPLDLSGKTSASLTAKLNYDIEAGYDYAFLEVSSDNGATWTSVPSGGLTDPNVNNGIDGSTDGNWVDASFDLSPFAGKPVQVRFRYTTDGGVALDGLFVDDISITADGATVLTDGAENGDNGWTLGGFRRTTGTEQAAYSNYYVLENKQYVSWDTTLKTGPYNFGFTRGPDYAERFPYQDGLLISYWDTSQSDNNVGEHPGQGRILPIDARPTLFNDPTGAPWRTRIQVFDATFGLQRTDAITVYRNGVPKTQPSQPAVSTFDDRKTWYDAAGAARCTRGTGAACAGSAVPPKTGTVVRVVGQSAGGFLQVEVTAPPAS